MPSILHLFFHNQTNDRTEGGNVHIPKNHADWPDSWKELEYKSYDLLPKFLFKRNEGLLFTNFIKNRKSSSEYLKNNKVVTEDFLSYIFLCGYGLQTPIVGGNTFRQEYRSVPSAGQRYPLEIYCLIFKPVGSLTPGIYHYNIKHHALDTVYLKSFSKEDIENITPQESFQEANCLVIMTAYFERSSRKYGDRAYRYILLEAGHVGQNMLLAGTELNLCITPAGAINEKELEKIIGLVGPKERVVYGLFI